MNPINDLLQRAFETGALTVEHRPELLGAFEPVPAKFVLFLRVGLTKVRITEVDAQPYLLERMTPPHIRSA